jgi:hypothetical protein
MLSSLLGIVECSLDLCPLRPMVGLHVGPRVTLNRLYAIGRVAQSSSVVAGSSEIYACTSRAWQWREEGHPEATRWPW